MNRNATVTCGTPKTKNEAGKTAEKAAFSKGKANLHCLNFNQYNFSCMAFYHKGVFIHAAKSQDCPACRYVICGHSGKH